MMRPIGSRLHGALDYVTGATLIGASQLPPLRGRFAGRALGAAGAGHLAYSLFTDYELGLVKWIPYKAHLALDAVGALVLAAGPWLLGRDDPVDRWVPPAVGVYELSAVALSDPGGRGRLGAGVTHRAVTVDKPEPEVRALLEDPAAVRRFSPEGRWTGRYELRPAPGGRGTEIHAAAEAADLRRAKQLLEAGEIATADRAPAGRRGPVSAVLPAVDSGT
jgi:hypothetical protein